MVREGGGNVVSRGGVQWGGHHSKGQAGFQRPGRGDRDTPDILA